MRSTVSTALVVLLAVLCAGCGAIGSAPPAASATTSAAPALTAAPTTDLLDSPDAYAPLRGPVTVGDISFTPDDVQGKVAWQTRKSRSGITTLLTYPGSGTEVGMQVVSRVEVAAHKTMGELLDALAPLILSKGALLTPLDSFETTSSDGKVTRTPVTDLIGNDDCIAASSYTVGSDHGIFTVVVPGCGGVGVTIDSFSRGGADDQDNAVLPQLIVPAVVGR